MLQWKLESSYLALPEPFYTPVEGAAPANPEWAVFNVPLSEALGLGSAPEEEDLLFLSGAKAPPGTKPYAQAYAGHQFGRFTILGDGRAMVLGEVRDPQGLRWDLQLKGSGPTPYARGGDGKAHLGPMLREYLIGEYLHAVGIPSTRALSVALSGEAVLRDRAKPGAILCRVASSHIRIGTLQYAAVLSDPAALGALADYAIARHFPHLAEEANPYLAFLDAVGAAQADLVARWMCLGFVHGVMNTDNVAVSGQAVDFGPCAFLDAYRSGQVFSSIDRNGRYSWGRQPAAAAWNHARLAESLLPLLDDDPEAALVLAQESTERFNDVMEERLSSGFAKKLGLRALRPGDEALIQGLLSWMEEQGVDFTACFRALTQKASQAVPAYTLPPKDWLELWSRRIREETDPHELMAECNPPIHPRNLPVQSALDAAEAGDLGPFLRLAAALSKPWAPDSDLIELKPSEHPGSTPFRTYCGT